MTIYGPIRGFEIWHGAVIDGIRVKYGDVWGELHKGGGSHKDMVEFAPDEELIGVAMDMGPFSGHEVTSFPFHLSG